MFHWLTPPFKERHIRVLRAMAFVLIAAWMLFGPVYRQVLGEVDVIFRKWTMFSGIGINMLDVAFYTREPGGTLAILDHKSVLLYSDDTRPERVMQLADVYNIGFRLCDVLQGADVRVVARRATKQGWKDLPQFSGTENMCMVTRRL